jgi:hypothetical protein
MRKVPLSVAAVQLSELAEAALNGEEVVILADDGHPLVQLVSIPRGKFKLGVLPPGALGEGPDFLAPMDEEELAAWEGRS